MTDNLEDRIDFDKARYEAKMRYDWIDFDKVLNDLFLKYMNNENDEKIMAGVAHDVLSVFERMSDLWYSPECIVSYWTVWKNIKGDFDG